MPEFTAKDVKALRDATGAGMMDAKKALAGERRRPARPPPSGSARRAWPRSAKREDRDNSQGAVAVAVDGDVGRHRRAQVRDRLLGQGRATSSSSCRRWPTLVRGRGRGRGRRARRRASTT